jgi:hypothetical protein
LPSYCDETPRLPKPSPLLLTSAMPAPSPILAPIVALVTWTFVIWAWMYATRLPAIRAARMQLDPTTPRGQQMSELPPRVRWKADNYNHLLEQPTLFYAVAIVLALLNEGHGLNLALAWCYVGLRVVHSFVQTLVNKIEIRFGLFFLSSLALAAMTVRAGLAVV